MHLLFALLMAPAQGQENSGGNLMTTLVMFGAIILVFYFLILRPQQKRQSEHKKLLEGVKKGDKVITSSGIHGVVAGMEDNTVLVQIADNVKVKFEKHSIANVVKSGD